jgi:glycosyltransferase involved in cell wall biosynthesis
MEFECLMPDREVATIAIYPEQGRSHSTEQNLSALAAYTKSLLSALPLDERKRHLVLTNVKRFPSAVFDDNDMQIRECWEKGKLRYAWQILREIHRTPSLKVIHIQHEFNQFGGVLTVALIPVLLCAIRFILRKRVLVTIHEVVGRELLKPGQVENFYLPLPGHIAMYMFRFYYRVVAFAASGIFVQHVRFRRILDEEMGVRGFVHILPIGTEDDAQLADRDTSRRKYALRETDRVLLFFGALDWRKGLDVLLDAFEQVPSQGYRLIIAGGLPGRTKDHPEYKQWHASLSARIRKNPAITQIGFVEDQDVPVLFAAADLVVLPYVVHQTVSAVLNHAASYERPFIGSDAFVEHVDKLVLFSANAGSLSQKIVWCFDGHLDELAAYSKDYKRANSWSHSAAILAIRYKSCINDEKLKKR